MRRTTRTVLLLACLVALPARDAAAQMDHPPDLLDAAWANECKTLVKLIQAAGLTATLGDGAKSRGGPHTLFAPTDKAFERLPKGTVDRWLQPQHQAELKAVLLRHVLAKRVSSAALKASVLKTVGGSSLWVEPRAGGALRVGVATVVKRDVVTSNGVLHVVDAVLLPAPVHGQVVTDLRGKPVALSRYRGKVVLIVNTASKCGFTPQYKGLEALYQRYKARGLVVLAFPCNDFGGQEPGTPAQIEAFCAETYKVTFPVLGKVRIRAAQPSPLFDLLAKASGTRVRWNFTKFLVGRDGRVVAGYGSRTQPLAKELTTALETALGPVPKPTPKPKKRWF